MINLVEARTNSERDVNKLSAGLNVVVGARDGRFGSKLGQIGFFRSDFSAFGAPRQMH